MSEFERRADRRRVLRRALAAGALFGAGPLGSAVLTACGGDDHQGPALANPTAATGPQGSITMALSTLGDQSTDPHVTRVANLAPITTSCFEQFSRWDQDGNLVPALADRMEESPDHAQLTFRMRPDATFWDGSPVTSEDAAWSFQRYISLANGDTYQATIKQQIDSVVATDAATVVVKMRMPSTLRLSLGIINPRGWNIASRAYYERVGEDTFRKSPMCSGPFKLAQSEPLQFVQLEASTGHYERVPAVQSIRMDIVSDPSVRLSRLQAGEADFIDGVAGPVRKQLNGDSRVQIYDSPSAALTTLYFQQPNGAPYNDERVRRALQLATDQQALITTLFDGAATRSPAAHIFPVTRGYDAALFPPQPFDPAQAKALIAQAGVAGSKVKLKGYDSSSAPLIPSMLEAVAGMWRDAGIETEIEIQEAGAYFTRYSAHELDGITALASGAWFDGEALLRTDYLDGEPFSPPLPAQMAGAIRRLGSEFDEEQRVAGIQDVYRQIIDGAWSVTLPWTNAAWAVRRSAIKSWRPYTAWAYPHAFDTLEPA